jgi:hypothetical protein
MHTLPEDSAEQARTWCEDRARGGGRPCSSTSGPDRATLEVAGIGQSLAG